MIWPWYKNASLPDDEKRALYRALLEYDPDQVILELSETYRGSFYERTTSQFRERLARFRQKRDRRSSMMVEFAEAYQSINPHPSSKAAREAIHSNV